MKSLVPLRIISQALDLLPGYRKPQPVGACPGLAVLRRPAAWGQGLVPPGLGIAAWSSLHLQMLHRAFLWSAFVGLCAMDFHVGIVSSHLSTCIWPRELLVALEESRVRGFIAQKSLTLLLLRKRVGEQLQALSGLMERKRIMNTQMLHDEKHKPPPSFSQ